MTWIFACLLIGAPASTTASDLDARIAASAAAAERLQGPLDGEWIVRDRHGQILLRLEIEDPPPGSARPAGAWSRADGSAMGSIAMLDATHGRVRIDVAPGRRLTLRRGQGGWSGKLAQDGRMVPVTLARR